MSSTEISYFILENRKSTGIFVIQYEIDSSYRNCLSSWIFLIEKAMFTLSMCLSLNFALLWEVISITLHKNRNNFEAYIWFLKRPWNISSRTFLGKFGKEIYFKWHFLQNLLFVCLRIMVLSIMVSWVEIVEILRLALKMHLTFYYHFNAKKISISNLSSKIWILWFEIYI